MEHRVEKFNILNNYWDKNKIYNADYKKKRKKNVNVKNFFLVFHKKKQKQIKSVPEEFL